MRRTTAATHGSCGDDICARLPNSAGAGAARGREAIGHKASRNGDARGKGRACGRRIANEVQVAVRADDATALFRRLRFHSALPRRFRATGARGICDRPRRCRRAHAAISPAGRATDVRAQDGGVAACRQRDFRYHRASDAIDLQCRRPLAHGREAACAGTRLLAADPRLRRQDRLADRHRTRALTCGRGISRQICRIGTAPRPS